jgi:hypothetical protein
VVYESAAPCGQFVCRVRQVSLVAVPQGCTWPQGGASVVLTLSRLSRHGVGALVLWSGCAGVRLGICARQLEGCVGQSSKYRNNIRGYGYQEGRLAATLIPLLPSLKSQA